MKEACYRGDLYYADLGTGVGSEQNGYRPVVIIQNDVGNRYSPTTIVAAISTQIITKANLPTHYYLEQGNGLPQPSMVMLEQLRTVDKSRLVKYIGRLEPKDVRGVNHALAISIGLIPNIRNRVTLCLCSSCIEIFSATEAYDVHSVHTQHGESGACDYCSNRKGSLYNITPKTDRMK